MGAPERRWLLTGAVAAPFVVFLAVYLPAVGQGFIQDDYAWILMSRVRSLQDLLGVFQEDNGFYRPVVSLTFALNEWLFGTNPLGYGLTNLVLALGCAGAIWRLAKALQLPAAARLFAGALWLSNFHSTRMTVLWISGRTGLLLVLFATLAAADVVRGRLGRALLLTAAALFTKEEAVALPLILMAWLFIPGLLVERRRYAMGLWVAGSIVIEGAYFLARSATNAMTPATAPSFYQPVSTLAALGENILSYSDRVGTLPLVSVLIAMVVVGRAANPFSTQVRPITYAGLVWLAGSFALTIFGPVRSDVYVALPSVGVCLIAATVLAALWARAPASRRPRLASVGVAVAILVGVIHFTRLDRWVGTARFGARVLEDLTESVRDLPERAVVVLEDDRSQRANLGSAFGTLLPEAYLVTTGRHMTFIVEPPKAAVGPEVRRMRVEGGRLAPSASARPPIHR